MATVPTSYLTSTKNLDKVLDAIRRAEVPSKFTYDFLKQLGFSSSADRPIIPLFKAMGFLDQGSNPTDRYRRYKNAAESKAIMAEGLREAYRDVFAVDPEAYKLNNEQMKGIFARLSGKSDRVAELMALTFKSLSKNADFTAVPGSSSSSSYSSSDRVEKDVEDAADISGDDSKGANGGGDTGTGDRESGRTRGLELHHDIHVHLPESTNVEVYDAIFRALRENFS